MQAQGGALKILYTENDRLQGFVLLDDVARAGIYTTLVREKVPLSSIDFELVRQHPGLMAFSRKERTRQLGRMEA